MRLADAWNQSARAVKACSVLVLAIFVPWTVIALLAFCLSYLLGADPDLLKDETIVLGLLVGMNGVSLFMFLVGSFRISLPALQQTAPHRLQTTSSLKV